jgi:hypothetical protein
VKAYLKCVMLGLVLGLVGGSVLGHVQNHQFFHDLFHGEAINHWRKMMLSVLRKPIHVLSRTH